MLRGSSLTTIKPFPKSMLSIYNGTLRLIFICSNKNILYTVLRT